MSWPQTGRVASTSWSSVRTVSTSWRWRRSRRTAFARHDRHYVPAAASAWTMITWREAGVERGRFATGVCTDGTVVRGSREAVWCDAQRRLVRFRRMLEITRPNGSVRRREWPEQKHRPSTPEMREWLEGNGFEKRALWGDRTRCAYTGRAERAVFWARLRVPAAQVAALVRSWHFFEAARRDSGGGFSGCHGPEYGKSGGL
jgi:hypothetical protein